MRGGGKSRLLAVLNLSPGATASAIKARYRDLAKTLHPDVIGTSAGSERFATITDAYQKLVGSDAHDEVEDAIPSSEQSPAMQARWNIRRRAGAAREYPAWFDPEKKDSG